MNKHVLILFMVFSQAAMSQSTDFSWQIGNSTCLPIDIQFTQTSSGNPVGYLWDFGNGTRSNSANPIATFTTPGTFSVRLITVYANNTAQQVKTIVIHNSISTSFTSDRNYMCQPGAVNFTAANSGSLDHYQWDFGDGTTPVNSNSNNISHNYTGYGEFTVTLTAINTSGCSVTATRIIKVIRPAVSGSITSELTGCIPMATDFTSTVNTAPGTSVTNYLWDFGDGNSTNSSSPGISHVYGQVGSFSPSLTITTSEGCTSTFRFDSVAYGRPPTNNSAYPLDTVYCGSEIPQFVSFAPTANRYDWDFGGGNITSVTDTLIEHRYTNLGTKNITVTPVLNGCPGNPTALRINIIGVIARYNYANTCTDKKTFQFNNISQGNISSINWSLGNQAYSTALQSVSHTYPASGTFNVKLLITDNITGCVDSFKSRIYTANPVLNDSDLSICINTDTRFKITSNYANPALAYLWKVIGKEITGSESTLLVHADSLGHFNNMVVLNNGPQYCPDTVKLDHIITVRGPQLDFTAPTTICLNVPLTVINSSHPYQAADSIRSWAWNFGKPEYNDYVFQPLPFTYPSSKIYNVKLTATDKYGCQDSLVKRVIVRPMPFLWIIPKMDTLCQGQNSKLIGYTSDNILWSAAAGPAFCTTCDSTTVAPTQTTKYYATATNSYNCTSTDSALVKVITPFTAVAISSSEAICQGGKVQLEVNPRDKIVIWTPPAGLSNINIYNPTASPVQSKTYRVTLTDSAGCFSSSTDVSVRVKSSPSVDAGPNKVYPYNSSFTLTPTYSSNITSWLWAPADSLSCATCATPSGIALGTKTYTITTTSDSGCVATDNITVFVECKGANLLMPTAFTPNNDSRNDFYRPIARGIKHINRFAIFNRQGQLVYEQTNFTPNKEAAGGWDGKFQGRDAAPAAYVYFVEAVCDLGQTIFSKGSFVLIR